MISLDTLGTIATIGSFVGPILVGGVLWLRKVDKSMDRVEAQFRNNGGSSLKDSVDRLESILTSHIEVAELADSATRHALRNINAAFLGHLEMHDYPLTGKRNAS